MKFFILFILFLAVPYFYGQTDTISIVSYNLLNFPDGRDDCGTNVVVPNRADTLRKITQYLQPDIFVACEIQNQEGADSILTRSLNVYGAQHYASATFNGGSSPFGLYNQLYYNTQKLTLKSQDVIVTNPRDIDHYVLYVNDPTLHLYYDTTFIEVYMCHLKAGNSSSSRTIRAQQTSELMNYIATRPMDRNHFICGDLNVYSSTEQAYQNLTTGAVSVVDPINSPGNWNNNGSFASIHTQSTRSTYNYDCGSKGGSDDRFDQILVSPNVLSGSDSLRYLTNSYDAVGNDGNHFNSSLLSSPVNTQYPDSVVNALYYMSDHLPVALKAVVTYPTSNGLALYPNISSVSCSGGNDGSITIVPNDGQAPYTYQWDANAGNQTTATANNLTTGTYCVEVTDALGQVDNLCAFVGTPQPLTYNTFITPDSDNCNGEAHLLLGGGAAPYNVTWNDSDNQTGLSAFNLCAGSYEATIIDNAGCTTVVNINIAYVGLEEQTPLDVKLFPNPAQTNLHIQLNTNTSGTIAIVDMFNRNVAEYEINGTKTSINIEDIKSGFYFLTINDNSSSRKAQLRFVKE